MTSKPYKRPDIIQARLDMEKAEGAKMFLGLPDRWLERPKWRCDNGHVSSMHLKTDQFDACLACHGPVWITFPEDREDPRTGEKSP